MILHHRRRPHQTIHRTSYSPRARVPRSLRPLYLVQHHSHRIPLAHLRLHFVRFLAPSPRRLLTLNYQLQTGISLMMRIHTHPPLCMISLQRLGTHRTNLILRTDLCRPRSQSERLSRARLPVRQRNFRLSRPSLLLPRHLTRQRPRF